VSRTRAGDDGVGFVQTRSSRADCDSEVAMHGYRLAGAWLLVGLIVTGAGIQAGQVAIERRLDPAIGPPILDSYESIRDSQDWLNPYLSVCPQGVLLDVRSIRRIDETVSPEALRTVLLDLPLTAWPYGRIVALQDCSLGIPGDTEERKRRMLEVEKVLHTLGVDSSRWPG
jgi:hypothetical protein